ncbi:MAG: RpiB/LacA/LacB family sugar-phosphate isomerase [Patescibacteria group bacterium]
MTIFIGADHRGFELKTKLVEFLQDQNIRVEDLGNYEFIAEDDYPDYAKKVAQAVLQKPNEFIGILICGGGGVEMAANRYKGIRCALGFDKEQVKHIRENDHANILAIPADYIDFETAKEFVDIFLKTEMKQDSKYLRRVKKLDE